MPLKLFEYFGYEMIDPVESLAAAVAVAYLNSKD